MIQSDESIQGSILEGFYEKMQNSMGINLLEGFNHSGKSEQGPSKSIFIYHSLGESPEQEFIIDIEMDLNAKTAVLYHIALPTDMRNKGLGTGIVIEVEKMFAQLGINYITLPAEHHSTEFWLKMGYRFKHDHEHQFYITNAHRENLRVAYELEKILEERF